MKITKCYDCTNNVHDIFSSWTGNLSDPANGQVTLTAGTTLGQTAVYSCNTGYNLVGDSTLTCQTSGNWSGSEPTCEGVYVVNLACFTGLPTS